MNCNAAICHARRGWPVAEAAALLFLLALLCGCRQSPADHLLDYQQRVARVLELSPATSAALPRVNRAAAVHNRLPLPESNLNLLEYLSLSECRMTAAISDKNTSLAKVAAASQTLPYELDILRYGPQCVQAVRDRDVALADKLAQALASKQAARMHYWWNAWFTGREWQAFTATAAAPLDWQDTDDAYLQHGLGALDYALAQGLAIERQQWPSTSAMETQLQALLLSETAGRWLASQWLLTQTLNDVAALLQQRQQQRPLCPMGRRTPKAEILNNVFVKIYAARVQPYLARTDRAGRQLLERLTAIEQRMQGTVLPPAFTQWLAAVHRAHAAFLAANQRHIQAWQATLRACELMPGR